MKATHGYYATFVLFVTYDICWGQGAEAPKVETPRMSCYTCNSNTNANCLHDKSLLEKEWKQDCVPEGSEDNENSGLRWAINGCYKTTSIIRDSWNKFDVVYVDRGCSFRLGHETSIVFGCEAHRSPGSGHYESCKCQTSNCNAGTMNYVPVPMIIMTAAFLLYQYAH